MSNTSIEPLPCTADRIKLGLAVLVVIAGIVGFSMLDAQPMVARVSACLSAAWSSRRCFAWFSEPGRRTLSLPASGVQRSQASLVVTRKETIQMTGIVFAFVAVMGLLMWVLDKGIEWVL